MTQNAYILFGSGSQDTSGILPSTRGLFKILVDGQQLYPFGTPIPVLDKSKGRCTSFAIVKEIHIQQEVTIVFFTKIKLSDKDLGEKIYRTFLMGPHESPSYASSSGSRATSTMDPALVMSLGMDKDPQSIADDQNTRNRYRVPSLTEEMEFPFDDDDY